MKRTILYMLCVFMTGVVMSVYGGTYYVATNGLNANPGTETQPWRTIQKAGNTMTAGDIVLIRGGRYSERVLPGASGTSNAPIVYRAYPGETSILDGSGISMTVDDGLFELESLANIEIHDLYIVNSSGSGVLLAYSTNILVCGNTTSNTVQSGVGAWRSAAINIISNEIILACNDGENECITVDTTAGFSVCHNHVHHGGPGSDGGEGIDIKNGSHSGNVFSNHVHHLNRLGIYIDSWTRYTYDITVHNNKIHHCPSGIAVASEEGGLLQNVRVCNNIVYSNSYGLFVAGKWGVAPKNPISDIYILNNTFADNMDPSWGGGIMVENEDCTNIVIRNNICSQNESFQIAVETNVPWSELSIEYNLIDGYRGEDPDEETSGSNYVEGAALFLNRAIGDFRLQYGSPAIDNGTAEDAPEDDFSGRARPLDGDFDGTATVDMGACEYLNRAADSDGDTMTDGWEDDYGLDPTDDSDAAGNLDNDPHSNADEHIADTDPTNAASYFRVISISNNSPMRVSFDSSSNRVYSLRGNESLMIGQWSLVEGATNHTGVGGPDSLQDTNLPARGPFYRLEVELP